jgi:hypothetical protein
MFFVLVEWAKLYLIAPVFGVVLTAPWFINGWAFASADPRMLAAYSMVVGAIL